MLGISVDERILSVVIGLSRCQRSNTLQICFLLYNTWDVAQTIYTIFLIIWCHKLHYSYTCFSFFLSINKISFWIDYRVLISWWSDNDLQDNLSVRLCRPNRSALLSYYLIISKLMNNYYEKFSFTPHYISAVRKEFVANPLVFSDHWSLASLYFLEKRWI